MSALLPVRLPALPALVGLILSAGCGPKPEPPPPAPDAAADPCYLTAPAVAPAGTVSVALTETVFPERMASPESDAERLVHHQLYETLVRRGCRSGFDPEIAAAWTAEDGGRRWRFTLRAGAQYADGEDVTASRISGAWRRFAAPGGARVGSPLRFVDLDVVGTLEGRELLVPLTEPSGPDPALFTHPTLAVMRGHPESGWPVGTRGYVAGSETQESDLVLVPLPKADMFQPPSPTLQFTFHVGEDPRDLLAQGADVMVVRDLDVVDYAREHPDYEAVPLEWNRLYVMLTPLLGRAYLPGNRGSREAREWLRERMDKNVTRADARPAHGAAFDVSLAGPCEASDPVDGVVAPAARPFTARVLYPVGDEDAKRIAERLVALLTLSGDTSWEGDPLANPRRVLAAPEDTPISASGLDRDAFAEALREGTDLAYVLPIDWSALDPCRLQITIRDAAPWMSAPPPASPPGASARQPEALPLVITRPYLVHHRRLAGFRAHRDGTPLLDRVGLAAAAAGAAP